MSGTSRERELKLGVPEAAGLDALLEAAGGERAAPVRQVNHFFDTPERGLRSHRVGFRLREEGSEWILTLKGPTALTASGRLAERVELEATIEAALARAVIEGERPAMELLTSLDLREPEARDLAATVREACAAEPLAYIGSFENLRTRVRTRLADHDTVLEFDRTSFGGDEVRFEVELEVRPEQSVEALARALEGLFTSAGVEPRPTTSKLVRFMEILDGPR